MNLPASMKPPRPPRPSLIAMAGFWMAVLAVGLAAFFAFQTAGAAHRRDFCESVESDVKIYSQITKAHLTSPTFRASIEEGLRTKQHLASRFGCTPR